MKNNAVVIKSSAAIHISNNITLLQRRVWNVMLANAYDQLPDEEEHRIRVRELMEVVEFDSNNELYFKESLKALTTCLVEWNLLDKYGEEEWTATTLLAQVKIRGGICTYAYSPELRRRLYNPRMYARISLSMQNKFDSKHAQALWELCVDYLHETRNYGETPFIPLPAYRKLMGIEEGMYSEFKLFNRRVVKEPVNEINRVTDFQVTAETKRENRKVTAIKFKTRRVQQQPGLDNRTLPLFKELEEMPNIVRELKDAGLAAKDAWEIFQRGTAYVEGEPRPEPEMFEGYIREKIHLLKQQRAAGKVKNVTGFLLQAIRSNYANPQYAEDMKRQQAKQEKEAKRIRERELEKLQEQKILTEKVRRVDAHGICERLMADRPECLDEAVASLQRTDEVFAKLYKQGVSPLANYRNMFFLQIKIDDELERLHPELFRETCAPYDAELAAIDARMEELQRAE